MPGLGLSRDGPDASADPDTLVKRAQNGDLVAFHDLVQAMTQPISNLAYRLGVAGCDIEDLTQQVWIKTWRNLPQFRFDSTFRTWMYQVTCNAVIDLGRRTNRRAITETAAVNRRDQDRPPDDPVPEIAMAREGCNDINDVLGNLRFEHRAALVLKAEGLSDRESAEILSITPKAFSSRLARARTAAKRLLSDRPQESGR